MLPQARKDGLLVEEVQEEVLIYDLERHKAHCLNRPAALIWRSCNGKNTIADMAALLEQKLGIPAREEWVWSAVKKLGRADLLTVQVGDTQRRPRYSRRAVLRKLGLGLAAGAILLPVITSIVVPAAASHGTCVHLGGSCNGTPCCAGCVCTLGLCAGTCSA